ncbi:MAG TPA: hypothetical protein VF708_00100 [Pyrinomonadaceae bacterium]
MSRAFHPGESSEGLKATVKSVGALHHNIVPLISFQDQAAEE